MTNLFILPTRLGDAILTTGVLDKYKDEPSVIVSTPLTAPIFSGLPHLEKVILVGKKPWKKHWIEMWRKTNGRSWNRIIDLRGSILSYFLKAEKRHVWKQPSSKCHKVLQISQFIKSEVPLSPTLWISEKRLAENPFSRPTLAVAPTAGWAGKQWPIKNFVTLLQEFCSKNPRAQVAFFGAPNERNQLVPLLEALPSDQWVNTIGEDLLTVAARIKSAKLFIGNDSGLMHLSAAVRTPTIALFGPSNNKIYGPWSDQSPSPHRVVRDMPIPVRKIIQTSEDTHCYMETLSISKVQDVLTERWEIVHS